MTARVIAEHCVWCGRESCVDLDCPGRPRMPDPDECPKCRDGMIGQLRCRACLAKLVSEVDWKARRLTSMLERTRADVARVTAERDEARAALADQTRTAAEREGEIARATVNDYVLAEREACAKLCDDIYERDVENSEPSNSAAHCAERIRARGQR